VYPVGILSRFVFVWFMWWPRALRGAPRCDLRVWMASVVFGLLGACGCGVSLLNSGSVEVVGRGGGHK
jgi:hypothetical protein